MAIIKKIDLSPFCAEEDGRYRFANPWIKGGWMCATNGAIAIRVSCGDKPDTAETENQKFPPLDSVIKHDESVATVKWPLGATPCKTCDMTGRKPCKECGRSGVCEHCGEGECPECHGKGDGGPCWECATPVGIHRINAKYQKMICRLPNVKYFPGDDPKVALQFVFDGGEGAVMGMKKDD
jgi:hypothetical protein